MIIKILPIPTATVLYSTFSSISIITGTIQSKISLLIITLTELSTSKIQIKQKTSGIYSIGSINYLIEQVFSRNHFHMTIDQILEQLPFEIQDATLQIDCVIDRQRDETTKLYEVWYLRPDNRTDGLCSHYTLLWALEQLLERYEGTL